MRWLLFLLFSVSCWATAYMSTQSGNWNVAATWGGGGFPGNGDTATIADGTTVTCPAAVTCIVGNSPAAGNIVLTLAGFTSQLIVSNTAVIKLRGDVSVHAGNAAVDPVITVQAGGEWQWDASLASSASTTHYVLAYDNPFGGRGFVANGSSGNHVKIDSNAGGGSGSFASLLSGNNFAGNYQLTYADVSNIGASSTNAFVMDYFDNTTSVVGLWSAQNSTFTSCGAISTTFRGNNNTFIHDGNIHVGTLSTDLFTGLSYTQATPGTGTVEIKNNVFDHGVSNASLSSFTISGNYFAQPFYWAGTNPWAAFNQNFLSTTQATCNNCFNGQGDIDYSYFFVDSDVGNPHVIGAGNNSTMTNSVFGQSGRALSDSGEFFEGQAVIALTLKTTILLPNAAGFSSLEMASIGPTTPNGYTAEHNTWFGGFDLSSQFSMGQLSEGTPATPGQLVSLRSNIMWNPELVGYPAHFLKVQDVSQSATPVQDICSPSGCDYNDGFNNDDVNTTACNPRRLQRFDQPRERLRG